MAVAFPPLLPTPRHLRRGSGDFALRDGLPIVIGPDADDSDFTAALALRDALREEGRVALAVESHARSDDLGPRIELRREGESGETYRLLVARDRIEATGAGPAGLRYAVETLRQLVTGRARVACCAIEDAPDLALRGLMLDISRGKVPTPRSLREILERCDGEELHAAALHGDDRVAGIAGVLVSVA